MSERGETKRAARGPCAGLVPVAASKPLLRLHSPADLEHEREASPAACWTSPAADFEHSTPPRWTPTATDLPDNDTEEWLQRVAGVSTELADRSADIRALLTAHAQTVADPRPELAMLAKWQPVSPTALRHRYNDHQVQAIRESLKADPLIDIVLEPFLSVIDSDVSDASPALDERLKRRRRMHSIVSEEFTALFGKNASSSSDSSETPRMNGSLDRSMIRRRSCQ
ncbi:hypothetical protein [Microbacterium esteraromaticum]|uniref:hypothetical protein n=1 Tax=Microbacterium esteraromaticum TaxID=57043 RepID=UPI001C963A67|nr:hypothetical protein [Microbacterium esteraromaticum]MBY6060065.1 hypothetical protein [Microbacterium esteraromaticum]